MGTLKARLEADMRASMKAREEITTSTLRMALAAIRNAEVAGKEARELSDDEVIVVLTKEAKKRKEAAAAFAEAGRTQSAQTELAEEQVLNGYLPTQLGDDELERIVGEAVKDYVGGGNAAMGKAMKAAQTAVAGRAEGGRVAALVKRLLAG
jgi:uncharacterized protein YqeY